MSFHFLPWPLYVLMTLAAGCAVLIYAKQSLKDSPKSLVIALISMGIGGILVGVRRLVYEVGILAEQHLWMVEIPIYVCLVLTFVLFPIGAYIKVKDDPEKRKLMLIIIAMLVVTLLFMALLVFFVIFR